MGRESAGLWVLIEGKVMRRRTMKRRTAWEGRSDEEQRREVRIRGEGLRRRRWTLKELRKFG